MEETCECKEPPRPIAARRQRPKRFYVSSLQSGDNFMVGKEARLGNRANRET